MKLEVYTKLKAGIAPSDIASQYSISKSTISEIKNIFVPKIETILVANLYLDTRKKSTPYPDLKKVFVDQQQALGKSISGALLQEKVQSIHTTCEGEIPCQIK